MTYQILTQSKVVKAQLRDDLPEFKTGTTISVHYKIIEEKRERVQVFTGLVISRHRGNGLDATFTVLKNATAGIKVHRTFPLHSPLIAKIELVSPLQRGRRSKLYYTAKLKDPIKALRSKLLKSQKSKVEEPTKDTKEVKKTTQKPAAKAVTKTK